MFDIVLITRSTSPLVMTSSTVGPASPILATTREASPLQGLRGAFGRHQPAAKLDQARDDGKDLGLVDVGDRKQHRATALDVNSRSGEGLAEGLAQRAADPNRLPCRLHLRP